MDDKEKFEWLYDHYKESNELRLKDQANRNKFFVWLCVAEAAAFLLICRPYDITTAFSEGINSKYGTHLAIGLGVFQTLLWVITLYIAIRYIQAMLSVERSYVYQEDLEKRMTEIGVPIQREGERYTADYPMVSNFIDLFYKMLCPIFFFILNGVRIVMEYRTIFCVTWHFVFDCILCIVLEVITWFYFFQIHSKITGWCKRHIPGIGKIANGLRKLLKEV